MTRYDETVIAIPEQYLTDFRRDAASALLQFGSMPQRAKMPWFTDAIAIDAALVLPDQVCGPRSEPVARTEPPARCLVAARDVRALLDGIAPTFRAPPGDESFWHCFPPGTMVGSHVPTAIEDVCAGMMVTGHDGRAHRVVAPMARPFCGELLRIDAVGPLPISCTPEHPFLVIKRLRTRNGNAYPRTHRFAGTHHATVAPQWVRADEIEVGDFLLTPHMDLSETRGLGDTITRPHIIPEHTRVLHGVPTLIREHQRVGQIRDVNLPRTPDTAWLIGFFVGDGSTSTTTVNTRSRGTVSIAMGLRDDHARAHRALRAMGLRPVITRHHNVVRVRATSRVLADLLAASCGRRAHDKHLPAWLFDGTWDIESALEGLMAADGSRTGARDTLVTVSRALAYQIYMLAASTGRHPIMGQYRNGSRSYKPGSSYYKVGWIADRATVTNFGAWHRADGYACPVRSITRTPFDGTVYNLEVDEVNSYVAGGLAVHNCHADNALNTNREGDRAGFAMGRIAHTEVERGEDALEQSYERVVRTFEIPLAAQIAAPVGKQIDLGAIVRLILLLKQERGFNITSFSMDGFQSSLMLQELAWAGLVTAGMRVEPNGEVTGIPKAFSVDRTPQPYNDLLVGVNERRVFLPRYTILRTEMRGLERLIPGDAPNHSDGSSKDVADACAGVVGYLSAYGHAELLTDIPVKDRSDFERELGWEAPMAFGPNDPWSGDDDEEITFGPE